MKLKKQKETNKRLENIGQSEGADNVQPEVKKSSSSNECDDVIYQRHAQRLVRYPVDIYIMFLLCS